MPYTVSEEAVTSQTSVPYNGYAHSFAGMGAQFILFSAIDLGIGILLERQRGLWKRLRSAPLSRFWLLAGKALSSGDHRLRDDARCVCVRDRRLQGADCR